MADEHSTDDTSSDAPAHAAGDVLPSDLPARRALAGYAAQAISPDHYSLDELLGQGSFEDSSTFGGTRAEAVSCAPAESAAAAADAATECKLPGFKQSMPDARAPSIDLLGDVEMNVKIELGRCRMSVEDVLKLAEGSVVALDKLAGDPVDVYVNDRLVARGEVLVLNDNFCVRVNEIVAGAKEEAM